MLESIDFTRFLIDDTVRKFIKKDLKGFDFAVIRKYLQQIMTNTDRQGANRELITFNSGRLSVFLSSLCYAIERHF